MLFNLKSGDYYKNPSPYKIAGRREACLRLLHDSLRQESWVGAFINTNKTAIYKSEKKGYEIPFIPQELSQLLDRMCQWNRRYLRPLQNLVSYIEESDGKSRFIKTPKENLPQICPLFRDPFISKKNRPPSKQKIVSLWLKILKETEERIKIERAIDLQLTEYNSKGYLVAKYDIHTLRVSGITAMIENGVPIEIVSQFVAGHATLVMTLWYLKNSPGKLREIISQAHEKFQQEENFIESDCFHKNIEHLSPFLLSKNHYRRINDEDIAYTALQKNTGLLNISTDGICPGTSCTTGGEFDENTKIYGIVPGGRRCGLCRYWITGPAFLLGQMAATNNLIYIIRKKGLDLKAAHDEVIDLEENDKLGLARKARSRVEILEKDIEIDILEWQARYNYAMQSSNLLEEYKKSRSKISEKSQAPAPLLTSNSEVDLKLTLAETDEFVLLEHVTQMSHIKSGFKNNEANLEKHHILSRLLENNGLPPLLLTLGKEKAELVGNLLSSMILQYVEAQDRERVFSGDLKIKDIKSLDIPLKSLTKQFDSKSPTLNTKKLTSDLNR